MDTAPTGGCRAAARQGANLDQRSAHGPQPRRSLMRAELITEGAPRACVLLEPERFERRLQARGAVAHFLLDGADRHVRVLGDLVGRADAGEVLQLARAGARVEALGVALLR